MKTKNKGIKTRKPIANYDGRRPKTVKAFIGKAAALFIIVAFIVVAMEKLQWFGEDSANNQTDWKWDWYYKMEQRNIPVDVLFVGNSHLLTGFNPYHFVKQSGLNCFLLGAPGVGVHDLYYTIEEAITVQKPKILVLETYAISNSDPYKLEQGGLNDQINSFRSRKNTMLKLKSTPALFRYKNYLIAWFDVFRNHNFIFTKPDQLKRNIKNGGPERRVRKNLYLGQFARFSKGISQATEERYAKEGAPVNGAKHKTSASSVRYTEKIAQLCKENDICLMFLTVPMYHKHVKNYEAWRAELESHIGGLSPYWLDLQKDGPAEVYTADAFEDTYSENQHLTNRGMSITAHLFAEYLHRKMPSLPDRKNDPKWQKMTAGPSFGS